jgi:homoserine O-acetyltransferase
LQLHSCTDPELRDRLGVDKIPLAVETFGELNAARSNAILFPTWFCSKVEQNRWLIGAGKALDPSRWFIVSVGLLGNGQSFSSSSQDRAPGRAVPFVSVLDNVRLQHAMLRERFGIERLALVAGRSMGGQAAFQWGSYYPQAVERIFCLATSSATSPHNAAFLSSLEATLLCAAESEDRLYDEAAARGLKAVARSLATWNLSQAYFRRRMFEPEHASLEAFLHSWEANFLQRDARDMLMQIRTWKAADLSNNDRYQGDVGAALAAIQARAVVIGADTDLYFPIEDNAREVERMPNASLRVMRTDWGHRAGSPGTDPVDIAQIDAALSDLLGPR